VRSPETGRPPARGRRGRIWGRALLGLVVVLAAAFGIVAAVGAQGGGGNDRRAPAADLVVRVDPSAASYRFRPGAIGLSIETSQLTGGVVGGRAQSLIALMRRLGPATVRVGGNSADRSWWTASGEPKPAWATNTITPADIGRLDALLKATRWRAIFTVDLGHPEPARAAEEAASVASILGPRLRAIEIGNEPNAYGTSVDRLRPASYGVAEYLAELRTYEAAISAAVPGVRFAGPDLSFAISSHTWLPAIAESRPVPFDEITHHYYPTAFNLPGGGCAPTPTPGAGQLLATRTREYENVLIGRVVAAGALAERPTRISETNTTSSCNAPGGPQTSPVFASALWSLDFSLRAASAGVTGLNFHGKIGRCSPDSSSPICAPRPADSPHPAARPEYYGLLAARRLEGGRFVKVRVAGRAVEGPAGATVTAYATVAPDGGLTVAIDDMAPHGTARLMLLAPGYTAAETTRLEAPTIHSRARVTLGGADFGGAGPSSPRPRKVRGGAGRFFLASPHDSAQIVTLTR
jgi:hypothetical protein